MLTYQNQVQLIGRSGHEVEMIQISDGSYRANLRIYQNEAGSDSFTAPQVFHLIAWSKVAEQLHRLVGRGDRILVQGKLVNRRLEQGGRTTFKAEIHVAFFTVLSSRSVTRSVGLAAEPASPTYATDE